MTTSRWLDKKGRGAGSMDKLVRRCHSGTLGSPIDRATLMTAVTLPPQRRVQPPACSDDDYDVMGRRDRFELEPDDEAAFEHLEQLLESVAEPATQSSSRPGSGQRQLHLREAADAVSDAVSVVEAMTPAGAESWPVAALPTGEGIEDHFPPPPLGIDGELGAPVLDPTRRPRVDESDAAHAMAAGYGNGHGRPPRPKARRRPRSTRQPASVFDLYLPMPSMLAAKRTALHSSGALRPMTPAVPHSSLSRAASVGEVSRSSSGVDARRTGLAGSPHLQPRHVVTATSLRSPDVLASFGTRYAAATSAKARPTSALSSSSSVRGLHGGAGGTTMGSLPRSRPPSSRPRSAASTPPPLVPLMNPVPQPLFGNRRGYGMSTGALGGWASESQLSLGSATAAGSTARLKAEYGRDPQSSMRMMLAEMMLGLRNTHSADALGRSASTAF